MFTLVLTVLIEIDGVGTADNSTPELTWITLPFFRGIGVIIFEAVSTFTPDDWDLSNEGNGDFNLLLLICLYPLRDLSIELFDGVVTNGDNTTGFRTGGEREREWESECVWERDREGEYNS